MLPNLSVVTLPLERLTRLYDGLEQLEELWDEGSEHDSAMDVELWTVDDNGEWVPTNDAEEWMTDDEDSMNVDQDDWTSSDGHTLHSPEPATTVPMNTEELKTPEMNPSRSQSSPGLTPTNGTADASYDKQLSVDSDSSSFSDDATRWKRFEILPNAPIDHAFYSSPPAQPSRFLARLNKEYRVLSSSLPGKNMSCHLCRDHF